MILQQLIQYYQENTDSLPAFGCEYKEISFVVLLSVEGDFLDIQDTRTLTGEGGKMLVPQSVKRSGTGAYPNCLWDNLKYVFGIGSYKNAKQQESLQEKRISFLNNVKRLSQTLSENKEVQAVVRFLESDFLKKLEKHPLWKEIIKLNVYLSFSVENTHRLVCQEDSVMQAISSFSKSQSEEESSFCLLTGNVDPVARLHPIIQGVYGAQGSGASLISYNLDSVESFGKQQGYNAPISESAAFAYSTALNHLLESSQKVAFNQSMTIVFWSQKKSCFEDVFSDFLKLSSKESLTSVLSSFAESEEDSLPFYVHALSPNGARLSLRFSWTGSIGELKKRIKKHFEDLEVVNFAKDQKLYSIYSLLHAFSPCHDVKYIQPNLAGEFLFSVLNDHAYPQNLLAILIGSLSDEEGVSHKRVSLLKSCMNRSSGTVKLHPSLDLLNQNMGYLLGRLFAIFEAANKMSKKKKEGPTTYSFYKIASIVPKRIFPHLLNRYAIHRHSLPEKCVEYFQKIRDLVVESFVVFPSNLSLKDQGQFAVGYYHQKQKIFLEIKKDE